MRDFDTGSICAFWGKTAPDDAGGAASTAKPVLHHLLDVAAVALRLQEGNPARLAREAGVVGISPERLSRTSAYLAGLHDLGKLSLSFQAKRPDLWPSALLGEWREIADRGHWRNTAIILRAPKPRGELRALFPELEDGLQLIAASIAGHHGRPPNADEYGFSTHGFANELEISDTCVAVAHETMRILREIIAPEPLPEIEELEQAQAMSWRLAGLTTLSDWVGSDSAFFTFEDPQMPLGDYWIHALRQAERAIVAKGLAPATVRLNVSLSTLAPDIKARPMQVSADTVPLPEGPALFVVEDTTGSGKTEAALALAARVMAAGKAEGLYFALPTMATANAMYHRLGVLRSRLFVGGAEPSLVLAHGRARLSRDFLSSLSNATNGRAEEDDNAAYCSKWIGDNRRKAFFAEIGAGTVDQAFLAVLKKKHLTLRQYGLAGRVLIVDEAHAFDAYMGKELATLLAVQASLGGSAIVLSATLPADRRQAIVDAFREGLGLAYQASLQSDRYPLLTVVGREGVVEEPVAFCPDLVRTIAVERVADPDAAHASALAAARKGAAVLVIRNAVDEAIASYEALRAEHRNTDLFHARFAMCDRQAIEQDVLQRFGREATAEDRAGRILVATQVVEQSLDLDFDLVISDLAPIDLLIQRAGRLWRHMDRRPLATRAVAGPTLQVIAPHPDEASRENWLEPALGRGAFTYKHPGVLWRTARVLFDAGAIRIPEDLRPFIERVYGEADVPECLRSGQDEAEGRGYGERFQASQNLINFAEGYSAVGNPSVDQEIGTRLGEETVTVRLARLDGERIVPWARSSVDKRQSPVDQEDADTQLWALSEISVRKNWLGDARPPASLSTLIVAAQAGWPDWEKQTIIIAVVEENGRIPVDGSRSEFSYSPATGLTRQPISTERS